MDLKALIFDSFYDKHRGVVAYVRVFNGELTKNQQIYFLGTSTKAELLEVGYFGVKEFLPSSKISTGEVGYLITGLKNLDLVRVGDTVSNVLKPENQLPGYQEVKPKVFSSIFPIDASDYPKLRDSIAKLTLNDSSLKYEVENIPTLGHGFRCGFLGLLHMDITQERLSREYELDLILTTPSVEYLVKLQGGETIHIKNPSELPDPSGIEAISEPWVKVEIITPEGYVGKIIELITSKRGSYTGINLLSGDQMQVMGKMPLSEMIVDFYNLLKSCTKGYATLSYEPSEYKPGDLVKVDFLVNKTLVNAMSIITHKTQAEDRGRKICEKLKKLIPRQQFEIAIQAAIGARVVARETVKAYRKDVTAKLYGGDATRRKKLLEKQKKGKKRMKMIGNVEIPQTAFLSVLKND